MRAHAIGRLVRFLIAGIAAVAVLALPHSPATAGGWAVGSLDSTPEAVAGESTEVGFTILQHGVTPADLTDDVGIEISNGDGSAAFFPAVSDGTPGHYVATVTFPDASGAYAWSIRMGWFGPHDLGTLDVGETPNGTTSMWSTFRWVTLGISVVLASVAAADLALDRRRRDVALG